MKGYNGRLIEMLDRIFYMPAKREKAYHDNPFSNINGTEITILMTPFSGFNDVYVDLPGDPYYRSILRFLKHGDKPAIILSSSNLDRLIIEAFKGSQNQPRLFMQAGNEAHKGFCYYKDKGMDFYDNKLVKLVEQIKPSSISVGGSYLAESEKELRDWDLDIYPWKHSADSGCFVGAIYLLFRDRYPTKIAEDLVKRDK